MSAPQPQGSSAQLDELMFMPTRTVRADQRPIWFVGAHGGAGTTTLARAVTGGADAGRFWPVPESGSPSKVVLVARSNAVGLGAAQKAAKQWALSDLKNEIELLGLAVMADAPGRLPRYLRDLIDLVAGAVPALWYLPWVEPLRFDGSLDLDGAPTPFKQLFSDLADLGWVDTLRTVASSGNDDTVLMRPSAGDRC